MTGEEYKEYRRRVVRESQRKRRMLARERGLCSICCNDLPEPGYKTCKQYRLIVTAKRNRR